MVRCKHGIEQGWCALCNPPPERKRRYPRSQMKKTVHGTKALTSAKLYYSGQQIVSTQNRQGNHTFLHLDETILFVHINGQPFLWVIKEILQKCSKLETIQVIPSMEVKVGKTARELCRRRKVEVVTGHWRPEMVWEKGRIVSHTYWHDKAFFLNLSDEQEKLFQELLIMGFVGARMTARYFCLKDEPYITQQELGSDFGFDKHSANRTCCKKINAVKRYLDPYFETPSEVVVAALNIKKKVKRIRSMLEQDADGRKLVNFANRMGLSGAIKNLPLIRVELFKQLATKYAAGELKQLEKEKPKKHKIFYLRFGIDGKGYKTLEYVGNIYGISRERVRQIEVECLRYIGLNEL